MPAYRSNAEGEIREEVVAWLRNIRPGARIIHEICACQGGCRIDVMSVDRSEIITVEIKSYRDKMDRAPEQIAAMRGCSHHVFLAAHRVHLVPEIIGNPRVAAVVLDDIPVIFKEPPEAKGAGLLVWPEPVDVDLGHRIGLWSKQEPRPAMSVPLPESAIHMLWRDELMALCADLSIPVRSKATMDTAIQALRWCASGAQITEGICSALRRRECCEADPPIEIAA